MNLNKHKDKENMDSWTFAYHMNTSWTIDTSFIDRPTADSSQNVEQS